MSSFTTTEGSGYPPGGSKEAVSIVKLWTAGDRVFGLLSATVRGVRLAGGALDVEAVRTVVYFSSDGTQQGLVVRAKTAAVGVRQNGADVGTLPEGQLYDGDGFVFGLLAPRVKFANDRLSIVAGGLFVALSAPATTQIPIPPQLGGRLIANQVDYVAGVIVDGSLARVPAFEFLPQLPHPGPAAPAQPAITGTLPGPPLQQLAPSQPAPAIVARFAVRDIEGSVWAPLAIVLFATVGVVGIVGRWSLRWPWARALSRYPPFSGVGWALRAFVKD
jgi:hypothetical protein